MCDLSEKKFSAKDLQGIMKTVAIPEGERILRCKEFLHREGIEEVFVSSIKEPHQGFDWCACCGLGEFGQKYTVFGVIVKTGSPKYFDAVCGSCLEVINEMDQEG